MAEEKYRQMADEAVIAHIREGSKDAMAYILDKYKGMVRKKARGLFLIGGESEDLIQEGMIGLFEAIQNYDEDRDTSFHSFAEMCVTRQLYTAVKASQRKKHGPLNSYVPLDAKGDADDASLEASLADALSAGRSAEDLVIDKVNAGLIEEKINDQLSPFEREVLRLYLSGVSYTEIAGILKKDQKSIDNALQRIRAKTKKCLAEEI